MDDAGSVSAYNPRKQNIYFYVVSNTQLTAQKPAETVALVFLLHCNVSLLLIVLD